jgi:hypothetical protein
MGGGAGADVPRLSAKRGPTVTPETGGVRHDGPPSGSWLAKIATSSSLRSGLSASKRRRPTSSSIGYLRRRHHVDMEDGPGAIPEDTLREHQPMVTGLEANELEDPGTGRDVRPAPIREAGV